MPLTSAGESAHQSAQGASAKAAKSRKSVSDGIHFHTSKYGEEAARQQKVHVPPGNRCTQFAPDASDEVAHMDLAQATVASVQGLMKKVHERKPARL